MLAHHSIRGSGAGEIAVNVEAALRDGRLSPGELLPPVRDLAATLGLSPATVAAAYRALATRGLVSAEGRRGTRITPRPPLSSRADSPVPGHLRNLAEGNPDPSLLPRLQLPRTFPGGPRLYGEPTNLPALVDLARRQMTADDIDATHLTVVSGAMDGLERVLQAHLRPGDRVAVEDPGYSAVFDLLSALGLIAEPMAVDDFGPVPAELQRCLRGGARGVVVTPRAQNPTGAALDEARARQLRTVLGRSPDVLVIEDDHAGPVAGAPALTVTKHRERWAVVRSVSKSLGPDLRVAVLAGDETTIARVEGRLALGAGWVSHVLQLAVATLWADPRTAPRLRAAAAEYARRREALIEALRGHGIAAHGRSGFNVWIAVAEEDAAVSALAAAGWALRAGARYRRRSGPAIRVTVSGLGPRDVSALAADIARSIRRGSRTASA